MTNLSQRGPQVRERSPGWRDAPQRQLGALEAETVSSPTRSLRRRPPQRQLGALEAETRAMPAQVPRHSTRTTNLLR